MQIDISWQQWKKTLSQAVQAAEWVGLKPQKINDLAYRVGNFMAKNIDPSNREQRLLSELWSIADEQEKKALANLLVRLVEKSPGTENQNRPIH